MRRRSFLRMSGAGLLGWMSGSFPLKAAARAASAPPVILRSPALEVLLDRDRGIPYEYRLPNGARLRGDQSADRLAIAFCDRRAWRFSELALAAKDVKATPDRADFRYLAMDHKKPVASFALSYVLKAATLQVTLEEVNEHDGYELLEVKLPRLVTIEEQDRGGWLAHGDDGGNLVQLSEAKAGMLPPNSFWGNVLATLPVVMMGTDRALCLQEVTALMDGTELRVEGEPGRRRASLGTTKTFRVNGSLDYDMNTGPGTPRIAGNSKTPNLLVGQKSSCRLDFIAAPAGGTVDWLDGVRLVRGRMPRIPTTYYSNRFVYGIRCDEPKYEKPTATFQECENLIRDVAALTGGWAQVVHLWGWQYRGKDTGYPAIEEVNQRLGGFDGLMKLMDEGRRHNCNVTFSDNYDDAYRSSPAWNPDYVARRPDQELWKSRNWTGEDSYVLGMAKYAKAHGLARVDRTCERYRLRESTHVDVLSYFPIRNDWDSANPASGYRNLVEGRYKILEQYAKHGIDVSSEALRYAFIGRVSCCWALQAPKPCPFDGKPIPLLPAVYRQSAVWGQSGRRGEFLDQLLHMFFYGGTPHVMIHAAVDRRQITDLFYLAMVPWFRVHSRNIEGFRRDGDRTIIELEGKSRIDLDWKARTYSVVADGVAIANTLATFCPLGEDRIAFYAAQAAQLSAPIPAGWNVKEIAAFALHADRMEPVEVQLADGKITVPVPAGQPVMVYKRNPV